MKKLIAIPLSLVVCVSAYAQGQVSYQNNSASRVYIQDGSGPVIYPTSTSGIRIEMFYQLDSGGAAPAAITSSGQLGAWEATSITGIQAIPGGGIFSGGIQTLADIAGGATVWIDIVGWNNNAVSLAAALSGASTRFNSSTVFAQVTGNPNGSPPTTPSPLYTPAPGAFTGLNLGVPEPSTLAIGAVGAASLLFFRRRK